MKKRIITFYQTSVISMLIRRYFQDRVGKSAAALAYYLIFSFFPCLIFISTLLSFMDLPPLTSHNFQAIIPSDVLSIINSYLEHIAGLNSPHFLFWGLFFTIYFIMRAVNCLQDSIYRSYRMKSKRSVLQQQIRTLLATLLLLFTVFAALLLLTVGRRILTYLSWFIPLETNSIDSWNLWRFFILAGILFFLIVIFYYFIPERKYTFRQVLPGIFAALISWLIFSIGFAYYVENMGNYSVVYGSIGAVIVLLLWLYFSAVTLILGAEFNSILAERRQKHS